MGILGLALLAAITVLFVQKAGTAGSLKCWHCDNFQFLLRGCSDPFLGSFHVTGDQAFIEDCDHTHTNHILILPNGTSITTNINPAFKMFCLKITGKLLGEVFVSRRCVLGLPNITEGSCLPGALGSRELLNRLPATIETCEACAGDLCNGTARMGTKTAILVALLQFLLLLK